MRHTVTQDAVDRPEAVLPADLLAILESASGILYADFVDPGPSLQSGDLRREFWLDTESGFVDGDLVDDVASE